MLSRLKSPWNRSKLKRTDEVSSTGVSSIKGGAEFLVTVPWADATGVGICVGGCGKSRHRLVSSALCLGRDALRVRVETLLDLRCSDSGI